MKIEVISKFPLFLGFPLAVACAGSAGPPATAADCAEPSATANSEVAPPSENGALPRYFTLELEGTHTLVDGQPLRGHDLSVRIDTEAKDERNGGALVRLDQEFSGEVLGALVWELSTAGFGHIIVWRRNEGEPPPHVLPPAEDGTEPSPAEEASQPAAASKAEPAEASSPEPSVGAATDVAPDASLRTIGLHVGGGPNDDATHAKFIAPIEKHFDSLLRCHALADRRDRNASVGVDLLVPVRGGKADLKDLRSALDSEKFQACIRAAFEQVSFPSVSRPTMISYSMLFEPNSDR
jgi:hypothetical protein